jgi:hypothetical protein
MFVAERFLSNLLKEYGKYPVSTDGGTCGILKHVDFLNCSIIFIPPKRKAV